jgi:Arc/MetJ-type ribon-helix-helix transcriptional regulator
LKQLRNVQPDHFVSKSDVIRALARRIDADRQGRDSRGRVGTESLVGPDLTSPAIGRATENASSRWLTRDHRQITV